MPVLIEPPGPDYTFNRDQYDALVADLEGLGLDVEVERQSEIRGGREYLELAAIVVTVLQAPQTIEWFATKIKQHLRGKRVGAAPTVKILYGPRGEELLEVPLDDE